MKAILLAAGRGSRLQADDLPKPLWSIGPRSQRDDTPISLLERQILCLQNSGVTEIGVVVGWRKEKVIDCVAPLGVHIIENTHPVITESGTSHSLQFAACSDWNPFDGESPVLLLDGDLAYERAVLDPIVQGPDQSRLLICPTTQEDSEEVRVYGDDHRMPKLMGKGLKTPLTDGLSLLGEATGIVRFAPKDHAFTRALLDWLVGRLHESKGFGFSKIASEHEELGQYLCNFGRISATLLPADLLFMEVDFQSEFDLLRADLYPKILAKDS